MIYCIPALLDRYKEYLKRLKEKGENFWVDQPRRKTDYHSTEAVTIAMFTPFTNEKVLKQLSVTKLVENIHVHVVATGQG